MHPSFLRFPSCVLYSCVCYHCVGMYPVYICMQQYLLQINVLSWTVNCILWWGSSCGALRVLSHLFVAITPRSTLTQSDIICEKSYLTKGSRFEQRSVIIFLVAEKYKLCEIYRSICNVHWEACLSKNVYKWLNMVWRCINNYPRMRVHFMHMWHRGQSGTWPSTK